MWKHHTIAVLSLFACVMVGGCGGKSTVADDLAGQNAGNGADASAGMGGSGAGGAAGTDGGGDGGTAGTAGEAGTGGSAGTMVDSGPGPCALVTGKGGCDPCMNQQCYDQCNACGAGAPCAAFVACALSCTSGDAACMQDCMAQYPDGVQDGLALVGPDGCLRTNCNAACIVAGEMCTLSLGDNACDECVAGYCMPECTTCADNDSCSKLVQCALSCDPDDQGCITGCAMQFPGGITDATAFSGPGGCVEKYCGAPCNGTSSQCTIDMGSPDCNACASSKCLATCNQCADNDSCVALLQCASACAPDDQGCITNCALQNPQGIADAQAFAGTTGCLSQKCPAQCGLGSATCSVDSGNLACDQCIASQCTGSCAKCSENPECLALVACTLACAPEDWQCPVQCGLDHSGGVQDAGPLVGPGGCVSADCSMWCP